MRRSSNLSQPLLCCSCHLVLQQVAWSPRLFSDGAHYHMDSKENAIVWNHRERAWTRRCHWGAGNNRARLRQKPPPQLWLCHFSGGGGSRCVPSSLPEEASYTSSSHPTWPAKTQVLFKKCLFCSFALLPELGISVVSLLTALESWLSFARLDKNGEEVVHALSKQEPVPIQCLLLPEEDARVIQHRHMAALKVECVSVVWHTPYSAPTTQFPSCLNLSNVTFKRSCNCARLLLWLFDLGCQWCLGRISQLLDSLHFERGGGLPTFGHSCSHLSVNHVCNSLPCCARNIFPSGKMVVSRLLPEFQETFKARNWPRLGSAKTYPSVVTPVSSFTGNVLATSWQSQHLLSLGSPRRLLFAHREASWCHKLKDDTHNPNQPLSWIGRKLSVGETCLEKM